MKTWPPNRYADSLAHGKLPERLWKMAELRSRLEDARLLVVGLSTEELANTRAILNAPEGPAFNIYTSAGTVVVTHEDLILGK